MDDHISVTGNIIVYNVQYLFIILHRLLIIYIGYKVFFFRKSDYCIYLVNQGMREIYKPHRKIGKNLVDLCFKN